VCWFDRLAGLLANWALDVGVFCGVDGIFEIEFVALLLLLSGSLCQKTSDYKA
jgi:hypothetical protein